MSTHITNSHLKFVQEAKEAFENNNLLETYWNKDDFDFIALRFGMDRDCVANFVQQMDPKPKPRKVVSRFAYDMEEQLLINDHKRGWEKEHHEFLNRELERNHVSFINALLLEDQDKHEITKRCANIANFAMMIADNYGTVREEN